MKNIKLYLKRNLPNYLLTPLLNFYIWYRFRNNAKHLSPINKSHLILSATIANNEYGSYCIPRRAIQRPAVQAILRGEVWEKNTLEFISRHCAEGDIVHAGTFFGDFIPYLSNSLKCGAQIWAFEPNPTSFKCAQITILLNELKNVNIFNSGLSDYSKDAQMHTYDADGKSRGGSSEILTKQSDVDSSLTEMVSLVSIDETIPSDRVVSVIQLDVEGFEEFALSGAFSVIDRCKPILILELLPKESWLIDNIYSRGYEMAGKVCGNYIFKIK
jgi:FkbM family methyltransferase